MKNKLFFQKQYSKSFVFLSFTSLVAFSQPTNDSVPFDDKAWDNFGSSSEENPDSNEKIDQDTTDEVENIVDTALDFSYAAFGKPDPFVPPSPKDAAGNIEIPIVNILQYYATSQLLLTGVWQIPDPQKREDLKRRALMTTPLSEGFVVAIGDPVGNLGGSVFAIEPDHIVVREFSVTDDGSRQFRDIPIWLGNKDPGTPEKIVISSGALKMSKQTHDLEDRDFIESKRDSRATDGSDSSEDGLPKKPSTVDTKKELPVSDSKKPDEKR